MTDSRDVEYARLAEIDAQIRAGDQVFVRATVRRVQGGQILVATSDDWRHWVAADQAMKVNDGTC